MVILLFVVYSYSIREDNHFNGNKQHILYVLLEGRGGVVVSAMKFRSEGRWFNAQSLPTCCFLRQETLPHLVSLHPVV